MGLSVFFALVTITLAYIAQTPSLLRRFRLMGTRFATRGRAFTGYALASLLLALGFFLAGVPLEGQPAGGTTEAEPTVVALDPPPTPPTGEATPEVEEGATATFTPRPSSLTPESGSFGQPRPETPSTNSENTPAAGGTDTEASPAPNTPRPTATPPATATATPTRTPTATPTNSPTPTATPSPTFTPTPISGPSATLVLNGGTVWLRRSPALDGYELVVLNDGTIVIPTGRRVNVAGLRWVEVQTADNGTVGWLQEEFLELSE